MLLLSLINFFFHFNVLNFIISFILIIIFVLTLLKKNYVNVYCLTAFNFIFLILFLTFIFQKFLINKSFFYRSFYVFTGTNLATYTFDIVLTSINLEMFIHSIRYNFLYMYNLAFYKIYLIK